jgi:ABC-type bacteriocin/lantibiotic exporter with double-glycine peptidase domain
MEVVIIGLGAISADYFNIMINHAIATKSLSDGLTFTFIFLIFYLLEELGHYILSLYTSKYFKINFHYLSRELIYALKQKRKSFLNKVDSNYFYLIDTSMQSITVFLVSEISGLCSNILLLFVTTTIISIINP